MSLAFLALLPQLIAAGISTEQEIAAILHAAHPTLSDAELNAIVAAIKSSAARHKALADADKGGG